MAWQSQIVLPKADVAVNFGGDQAVFLEGTNHLKMSLFPCNARPKRTYLALKVATVWSGLKWFWRGPLSQPPCIRSGAALPCNV